MAKVMTLSRQFPSYHPCAGEKTNFVASVWHVLYPDNLKGVSIPSELADDFGTWKYQREVIIPKHHTVRLKKQNDDGTFSGRWKDGDMASLRVWSGKPYNSPQIKIADDVKVRVVDIVLDFKSGLIYRNEGSIIHIISAFSLAANDGLPLQDFLDWFKYKENRKNGVAVEAQILIWGDVKEY
jgi:hypothetical protein